MIPPVYDRHGIPTMPSTSAADFPPLPPGPYGTIVVDPPWMYTHATRTTETPGTGWRKAGERHYSTMRFAEIAKLDVPSIAAGDALLWLWVVNPLLARGFDLLAAWGFTFKGLLTWAKTQRDWRTPFVGTGYWLRGATEHAMLGVRGKVTPSAGVVPSWFAAPVVGHSRKPDAAYSIFERFGPGPRVDLFARVERPGWTAWGDRVEVAPPSLLDLLDGEAAS